MESDAHKLALLKRTVDRFVICGFTFIVLLIAIDKTICLNYKACIVTS
jgi:hypothetical protein